MRETTSRELVESIKQEILSDPVYYEALERNRRGFGAGNHQADYRQHYPNAYDQAIADSVKEELLREMRARQVTRQAEMHGYGDIVSDRNINKMIRQRHRTLQDIRGDLLKELDAIQAMENGAGSAADPYIQDVARSIVEEARGRGLSINEVKQKLADNGAAGSGWFQRMFEALGAGQRKGFAYGIGAAVLAAILWPTFRQGLHSVAVQSMEGGMGLADRARSVATHLRDDFRDNFGDDSGEIVNEDYSGYREDTLKDNEPEPPVLEE